MTDFDVHSEQNLPPYSDSALDDWEVNLSDQSLADSVGIKENWEDHN